MHGLPKELLEGLKKLGFNVNVIPLGGIGDGQLKTADDMEVAARMNGKDAEREAAIEYLIEGISLYEKRLADAEKDRDKMRATSERIISDLRSNLTETKNDFEKLLERFSKAAEERTLYFNERISISDILDFPISSKTSKKTLLQTIADIKKIINSKDQTTIPR